MSSGTSKKTVKPVNFNWVKGSSVYDLQGKTVCYKAHGVEQYHMAVGDLALPPNSGRYFFEFRVNCDNTRIGLCTDKVDVNSEMGKGTEHISLNLQTGAIQVNGLETKRLWRLITPVSGGLFGFVFDSTKCTLELYLNTEYMGIVFGPECVLKEKVLHPCVGLSGVELNNRNIGVGKKTAVVTENPTPYHTLV